MTGGPSDPVARELARQLKPQPSANGEHAVEQTSRRSITLADASYRLNLALEWHQDGADEDAWDVVNALREEIDQGIRDTRSPV
jgi:hypothetical protein